MADIVDRDLEDGWVVRTPNSEHGTAFVGDRLRASGQLDEPACWLGDFLTFDLGRALILDQDRAELLARRHRALEAILIWDAVAEHLPDVGVEGESMAAQCIRRCIMLVAPAQTADAQQAPSVDRTLTSDLAGSHMARIRHRALGKEQVRPDRLDIINDVMEVARNSSRGSPPLRNVYGSVVCVFDHLRECTYLLGPGDTVGLALKRDQECASGVYREGDSEYSFHLVMFSGDRLSYQIRTRGTYRVVVAIGMMEPD